MDGLSAVLDQIRLKSTIYFKSAFKPFWGMEIPQGPFAQFHIIAEGDCCFQYGNEDPQQLHAGDILIFPNGTAHWLAHRREAPKLNGQEVVTSVQQGKSVFYGQHTATTIICGHFEFDRTVDHPFITSLPDIIHIGDMEHNDHKRLVSLADLLVQETQREAIGSNIISQRLAEALFINAIRYYIEQAHEQPFMAALFDQKISSVLQQIHAYPEKDWSLDNMSRVAGMSRSSFANHFREKVGQTPGQYLTNWRMLLAQRILSESEYPIDEIAEKVGYSSEPSFTRAFKKHLQQTPAKFRRAKEAA